MVRGDSFDSLGGRIKNLKTKVHSDFPEKKIHSDLEEKN